MVCDVSSEALVFEPVNDLRGMKYGVYREELGTRRVLVSPALYTLLQSDKAKVLENLMVELDGRLVWVMDLMRDR